MSVLNLCKCSASYLGMGHFMKYVIVMAISRSPFLGPLLPRAVLDGILIKFNLPRMTLLHLGYEWWASCFMGNTNSFRAKNRVCIELV